MELYHEVENPNVKEDIQKTWSHREQIYVVSQWITTTHDEFRRWHEHGMIGDIIYFNRGATKKEKEADRGIR